MTDREARYSSGRKSEQVADKDGEGARERREREQGQTCDWKREGRHIPLKCPLRGRSLGEQAGVAQRLDRQAVTTLGQGPAPLRHSHQPLLLAQARLAMPPLCPSVSQPPVDQLEPRNLTLPTNPPTSNPHPTVWLKPKLIRPIRATSVVWGTDWSLHKLSTLCLTRLAWCMWQDVCQNTTPFSFSGTCYYLLT